MGREKWISGQSPSAWGCLTKRPPLLLLLLLLLPQLGICQALCPSPETRNNLKEPQYGFLPELELDTGFMTGIVQSFLGLVQPNPFPKDLLVRLIEANRQITTEETIKEVLRYEIGFLVCVAIGVLYIVLMPLVGFCFACCRCCGNCGGHMYQEQTRSIHCRRRGLYWATLIITLVILAGNICMFASNESTKKSMKETPQRLDNTLDNLQTYLSTVPQQITSVENESTQTVDAVSNNLNDIGPLLGREIQKALEGPLMPALESVRSLAQVVSRTSGELTHLNSSLGRLQSDLAVLQANLTAVRDRINGTLRNPNCTNGCNIMQSELEQMSVDTTLNTPDLNELQSAVDKAQEANLDSVVKEGENFFDSIPERVTNETRSTVQSVKSELDSIKAQISKVKDDLPLNTLNEVSNQIDIAQNYVEQYSPEAENIEKYRWIVGVILCCLILLVVVCNLLGLFLGPAGLKPKADPTKRSGTADCGGLFFMAGVGFSFIFSWIFMLLVLILFLVGGNAYTLICKPWKTQELFQIIDTPGLIPGLNLSASLGLKTQLTITDIYRDCNQNKSLWITLHLEELINLNEFLNVSKYTEEIEQNFEKTNISISSVTLLSPDIVTQLKKFSEQAESVNFNTAIDEIIVFSSFGANLTIMADKLDWIANQQPADSSDVRLELAQEADDLRSISNEFNVTIKPQLLQVKSSIERLSTIASQINETVEDMLLKARVAQNFLNSNTSRIVKDESRDFLDCQLKYFTAFAEWAKITITQQLGQCGPVALAVNSAETIVCTHFVESLNAFWFSLGWCMVFLIPSIILSVKLSKFYRRMKEGDVFENPIPLTTFPRAAMKPY